VVLITVLGDDAAPLPLWASQYRKVGSLKGGWASGAEYDNPEESSRRLAFQGFWAGSRVFGQDAVFRQSRGHGGTHRTNWLIHPE
jgi:hypothetical protein